METEEVITKSELIKILKKIRSLAEDGGISDKRKVDEIHEMVDTMIDEWED